MARARKTQGIQDQGRLVNQPGPPRILMVDDDVFLLDPIRLLLVEAGFDVRTASSIEQALHLFETHHFDVLITDIMMPPGKFGAREAAGGYRSGLTLAQEVRRMYPNTKILGFSAAGDPEVAEPVRFLH